MKKIAPYSGLRCICYGLALLLAASNAAAGKYDYYECTLPDGSLANSMKPCAPGQKQRRVTDGAEATYEGPQSHIPVSDRATIAYRCIRFDNTSFISANPCPRYAEMPLSNATKAGVSSALPGTAPHSLRTSIRQEIIHTDGLADPRSQP